MGKKIVFVVPSKNSGKLFSDMEKIIEELEKNQWILDRTIRELESLGVNSDVVQRFLEWCDENPMSDGLNDLPQFVFDEIDRVVEEKRKIDFEQWFKDFYGIEPIDPAEAEFERNAVAMSQEEPFICDEDTLPTEGTMSVKGYQDIAQNPDICHCGHQDDNEPISHRKRCLDDAARCVLHDRDKQYGSPEDNFGIIADLWSTYLGNKMHGKLKPHDVAAMMALMKIARIATGEPKFDNWVDAVGYCACGCEVQGKEVMAE